jgi:hypothetical protein
MVAFTAGCSQLVKSRPVDRVVIFEFEITTHGLHEVAGGNVLSEIFIELELLSCVGIDERCDQLEEPPNEEGNCEEYR